ncbi:hypothetical protein CBM2629_U10002 [Cupriavidus taiwanensis]|nr:hypothetical protein CBM2629_U10002 [Cupriavidus taiwanensis]
MMPATRRIHISANIADRQSPAGSFSLACILNSGATKQNFTEGSRAYWPGQTAYIWLMLTLGLRMQRFAAIGRGAKRLPTRYALVFRLPSRQALRALSIM